MLELFGITFYWYGLLIGLGVWVAMEISLANRGKTEVVVLEKAIMWTVFSGVIGARLYHVIDFWSRIYSTNFERVFYLWDGGLGIWGAVIGGLIGLLIYCLFNKLKYWQLLDSLVIGVPLAQAIGRIGNLINGELIGKNGEPLWAYEGILNLILFGVLWKISRKTQNVGFASGVYFLGYGVIRIGLEGIRPNNAIWAAWGVPMAVIIGIFSCLAGIYLLVFYKLPTKSKYSTGA